MQLTATTVAGRISGTGLFDSQQYLSHILLSKVSIACVVLLGVMYHPLVSPLSGY
jgi:hypothetical protein